MIGGKGVAIRDAGTTKNEDVALSSFFRLTSAWDLSKEEERILLGSPNRSTFVRWRRGRRGNLSKDTLERISYLFGIYKALHTIFPKSPQADSWIKRPNSAPLFDGQSALDRMLDGRVADLLLVRQYLDSELQRN